MQASIASMAASMAAFMSFHQKCRCCGWPEPPRNYRTTTDYHRIVVQKIAHPPLARFLKFFFTTTGRMNNAEPRIVCLRIDLDEMLPRHAFPFVCSPCVGGYQRQTSSYGWVCYVPWHTAFIIIRSRPSPRLLQAKYQACSAECCCKDFRSSLLIPAVFCLRAYCGCHCMV